MEFFNDFLNKYKQLISNIDFNKIEILIINDVDYNKLDIVEKEVLIDIIKTSYTQTIMTETPVAPVVSVAPIAPIAPIVPVRKSAFDLSKVKSLSSAFASSMSFINTNVTGVIEPIKEGCWEKLTSIFNKLCLIVSPEQRTKEWLELRKGIISATGCGSVLGLNKNEAQYSFIYTKVFGSTFVPNEACYHGTKFENAIRLMYELNYDVIVRDFGLIVHDKHKFLGASPDGICGPYKRDGITRSDAVGRMVEIKSPKITGRKIKFSGEVIGEICPVYYYWQVLQQLECCDLPECDFVQCAIEEYDSRNDFLKDSGGIKNGITAEYYSKKSSLEKGVLIELVPSSIEGEVVGEVLYEKATFIYPPKIDMSNSELDEWISLELDIPRKDVRINRVVYWRILISSSTLIKRDIVLFDKNLPKLKEAWSYVEFLRNNMDIANKWKEFVDSMPRKYNDKIMAKLISLVNQEP